MASVWPEEETFVCPVCLETLRDPTTLPCGHTYCMPCIQGHWDRESTQARYSCPQCRARFTPRPPLARSTVLVEAMEKLRGHSVRDKEAALPVCLEVRPDATPHSVGVYPALPDLAEPPCPEHGKPLELYCHDDGTPVCQQCLEGEHRDHRVVEPEEERTEKQKELLQMKAQIQSRMEDTHRVLSELPHAAKQQKALAQALQSEMGAVFSELVAGVRLTGVQVEELLSAHEASLASRLEGDVQQLEQEVGQLRWKAQELEGLEDMQDHCCFLKNFATLQPLTQHGAILGTGLAQEEELVAEIRSSMAHLRDSVQDLCKDGLAQILRAVNDGSWATPLANGGTTAEMETTGENDAHDKESSAPPPPPPPREQIPPLPTDSLVSPAPQTREERLKFRFNPTFDPNTAFRQIRLSDDGRKATLRADKQNPTDHPERFLFWRQVLCKEPVAGSPFYWEVEWTGQKITIGVTYREVDRKGSGDQSRLGYNAVSWGLYWSGTGFSFWHRGQETQLGSSKARRVGVYLDQHAGLLAFYRVVKDQAQLIHSLQTHFSGPLYPGFRFWSGAGSTVSLCQLD